MPGRCSGVPTRWASFRFLSVSGAAWISLSDRTVSGVTHVDFLARPNKEAGSCHGVNGPSVFGCGVCARGGLFFWGGWGYFCIVNA